MIAEQLRDNLEAEYLAGEVEGFARDSLVGEDFVTDPFAEALAGPHQSIWWCIGDRLVLRLRAQFAVERLLHRLQRGLHPAVVAGGQRLADLRARQPRRVHPAGAIDEVVQLVDEQQLAASVTAKITELYQRVENVVEIADHDFDPWQHLQRQLERAQVVLVGAAADIADIHAAELEQRLARRRQAVEKTQATAAAAVVVDFERIHHTRAAARPGLDHQAGGAGRHALERGDRLALAGDLGRQVNHLFQMPFADRLERREQCADRLAGTGRRLDHQATGIAGRAVDLGREKALLGAKAGERKLERARLLADRFALRFDPAVPLQVAPQGPGDEVFEFGATEYLAPTLFAACRQRHPVETQVDLVEPVQAGVAGAVTFQLRPVQVQVVVVDGMRLHGLDLLDPRRRLVGEQQVDAPA